jgi:hypothetical protein
MKKKIKAKWIIKRVAGEVVVEQEQKIKCGDLILRDNTEVIKCFDCASVFRGLKKEKIKEILNPVLNKRLAKGELMFKFGGIFSKKVISPIGGVFLGIDDFSNFMFQVANDEIRDIFSPVDGFIDKIEKDQIVVAFEAIEFFGDGLVEGKVWGNCDLKEINTITELSSFLDGDIILTDNLERCFLTKAEVVGVKAFVVLEKENTLEIDTSLPVISLPRKEWDELQKYKDGVKRRFLLNSKIGRLLMVL